MNTIKPNTPDEIIALMQAFKDGKKIICRYIGSSLCIPTIWMPAQEPPLWNFAQHRYEVKKEPLELYAVFDSEGKVLSASGTKERFDTWIGHKIVRMREVIE